MTPDGDKIFDHTFSSVTITDGERDLFTISEREAVAFVAPVMLGLPMRALSCRSCGTPHLDVDSFSVHPHVRHLCERCGTITYAPGREACVSNPLADPESTFGIVPARRQVTLVDRPLEIRQDDYPGGIQLWAWNEALYMSIPKPEEAGLHLHAFETSMQSESEAPVNETYHPVWIDGNLIDLAQARVLMAQRSLPFLQGRIKSLVCPHCRMPHFDDALWAVSPHRDHLCETCRQVFRSPGGRRVVSSPLAGLIDHLYEEWKILRR